MAELLNGNQQWVDSSGAPLLNGKVYIGTQGADPVANPKSIFSDRALSSALANPQTLTSAGFSTNKIWLSGRYSIRVENSAGVLVKQELDNGETDQVSVSGLSTVAGINAITATNTPTITTYTDKNQFIFQVASLNTTDAVTLNVDGVGAKAIKRNFDQDVGKGKFKADQTVIVAYNSGKDYFEWINENARVIFETKGADIASASTVDLSLATGNDLEITGTTGPITSFGTVTAGVEFILTFASTPTITHNGTSMILPGDVDIVVQAGDIYRFRSLGSGNFILTSWQRATVKPGGIVQQVYVQDAVTATGTTVLVTDDTIPQITEGVEFMTLAITPKNALNILIIESMAILENNSNGDAAMLLFQDSTANGLAAVSADWGSAAPAIMTLRHRMAAGTTSSTTFRIRAGSVIAGTTAFNQDTMGGVMASHILITEYASL